MSEVPQFPPRPGAADAIALGCTCMARDGEPVDLDPRWPDWLTQGCPLHDPNINPPQESE